MSQPTGSHRHNWSLYAAALVAYAAVFAIALTREEPTQLRLWYAAVLAAFGALLLYQLFAAPGPLAQHLYLLAQTALVMGLMALDVQAYNIFSILFILLSAQAMFLPGQRVGLAWIALFTLITTVFSLWATGWPAGLALAALYAGSYFFFGIFSAAVARADAARVESQRLLGELQEAHARLQDYALQAQELAASEERNRLAREMHDTLGHALTMSVVQLEGAQRLVVTDPERASRIIGTVREALRGELGELRRTLAALRAPLEAELPLVQALSRLAGRFEEATRRKVHLALPVALPDLDADRRLAFYRAAQEALTNIQRHAQATQAWVVLAPDDGRVTLVVSDDGIGPQPGGAQPGFGWRGLQERAAQLGGAFHVDARPGGGTQLHFSLPIHAAGVDEPT